MVTLASWRRFASNPDMVRVLMMNDGDMVRGVGKTGTGTGSQSADIVPTEGMKITVGQTEGHNILTPGHTPDGLEHLQVHAMAGAR